MTDDARRQRNRDLLQQAHPGFRTPLALTIAHLEALSFRPRLQCVWRSLEDQATAQASGQSTVAYGFHNCTTPDGQPDALAADVLDDDHPLNPSREYVLALARNARANGLTTGITWGLPAAVRGLLVTAIVNGSEWESKIGWDPCHVEITGITIPQAKGGRRPKTPPAIVPI